MSNNYTTNAGSGGNTFASKDVSGTHYPAVAATWGTDGVATNVAVATPMPVESILSTAKLGNGGTQCAPVFVVVSAASAGDNTLVAAAGASNKIRVLGGMLVATGGANTVRFESGASGTALTGQMDIVSDGQLPIPFIPLGNFETAANTLLNLELSAATSVAGWLVYVVVV